jgi:hypothetical protein
MKNPFIIDYGAEGITGLVIPFDNKLCQIIWDDENDGSKVTISFVLKYFKVIKENLSEQEVLAWRLKNGV